jgi:hypothetical protein
MVVDLVKKVEDGMKFLLGENRLVWKIGVEDV